MKYRNNYDTITTAILLFIMAVWMFGVYLAIEANSIIKIFFSIVFLPYSWILVIDWLLT